LHTEENRNYSKVAKSNAEYVNKVLVHFTQPQPEEEGEEVPVPDPVGEVQDLLADVKTFQWAGIGFGEQETYRLQKSIKKLATDTGANELRFFGKILGTQKDYYVVEVTGETAEEEDAEIEREADFEAKGTPGGVNEKTYFVAENSLSEWKKLPELAPQEIEASRQIKVLFTGDLERNIYTNPFFYGQEKHYLRAQIARITHSTTLIPSGIQRIVEEEERETEENTPEEGELVWPSTGQMASPDMWVHANKNILKNNRTAHSEPEEPEEAPEEWDAEEAKKQLEAADPYEPRLKPITADKQVSLSSNVKQNAFVVRHFGDDQEYKNANTALPNTSYVVVVVRSLLWPGAYSFYYQGKVL